MMTAPLEQFVVFVVGSLPIVHHHVATTTALPNRMAAALPIAFLVEMNTISCCLRIRNTWLFKKPRRRRREWGGCSVACASHIITPWIPVAYYAKFPEKYEEYYLIRTLNHSVPGIESRSDRWR